MYITILNCDSDCVSVLFWDVDLEQTSNKDVEELLERIGYVRSHISYMLSEEEPNVCDCVDVKELLDCL